MRGITKRFPGVVALQDVSLHLRRGRGAGAHRRERRGQVHAHEGAGRGLRARRGRDPASTARPCASASVRDARRAGHRADPPGADAGAQPRRRRQHLPGQRGDRGTSWRPLRRRRHARRRPRRCSSAWASQHPPATPRLVPDGGRDADGRDRQGALPGRAHHHHGRADVLADRGRVGAAVPDHPASSARRASASSTSRTAWRRCWRWPTASRSCATGGTRASWPARTRRTRRSWP